MRKDIPKPALIFVLAISSFAGFLSLKKFFHDLISKNQYNTAECRVNDIIITPRQMRHRIINRAQITTKIDGKNIQLSPSQYKEILDKSEEYYQKIMIIYYLPNTKILLKYDFTIA